MFGRAAFGDMGQQASGDQCSFHMCTLFRAPIRVSYFLLAFFAFKLYSDLQSSANPIWFALLSAIGAQLVLMITVLVHEFGHGTMARKCGGEISHILLWPFGGICFSTRDERVEDPTTLIKQQFAIVAAGPATHFVQVLFWIVLLLIIQAGYGGEAATGVSAGGAIAAYLHPLGSATGWAATSMIAYTKGMGAALLWIIVSGAIQINVMLFLFNVFFPMYPADGAKLLTSSLMYFFGVPPRLAAKILLGMATPCALFFVGYALYTYGTGGGGGSLLLSGGVMGMMGVMSLGECYKIYGLLKSHQLHTHPLFVTARTRTRQVRDGQGGVRTLNNSALDNEGDDAAIDGLCCNYNTCCHALTNCCKPTVDSRAVFARGGGNIVGSQRVSPEEQEYHPPAASPHSQPQWSAASTAAVPVPSKGQPKMEPGRAAFLARIEKDKKSAPV